MEMDDNVNVKVIDLEQYKDDNQPHASIPVGPKEINVIPISAIRGLLDGTVEFNEDMMPIVKQIIIEWLDDRI